MLRAKKTRTAHITATTAIVKLLLLPSLELFKNFLPLVGSVSSACSVGSVFVAATIDVVLVIVSVVVGWLMDTEN